MLRLLTIEFQKLRYSRSAKVLSIIYFGLFTLIALIASIKFNLFGAEIHIADQGIFNFPYIWHFNTYCAALLKIFLAIVIVSLISNEYSNRTLKQNLIDGLSKKEFILSKFYVVASFSLISTVFIFIVSLILGLIFSDYTEIGIIFSDLEYLLAYFVKLLGFFSFCLFLGVLVKRSAFALGFLFVWWIFESIIIGVLRFLILKDAVTTEYISQFLPLESMANLVKQPFTRLNIIQSAANQLQTDVAFDYAVHWYQVIIVLGWTAIFIWGSLTLLKKRDL
ncbi:ABC-type transport system involved in multi-copper enzyme maturation permease subunit [Mesonia algae]|uniref:ABC-type transport system involved in multi-copper enzyme maturation permease subunit n=1 Tax=Mesonia algae TaxID=213248 RepID=A0A2W7I4Y9_9FLAO|nr:ABC transporter permease [Mesonia algae]PZW40532.1 ABC-type transport system involved in multi-copper enzyme maturation permease subunit [Mesonia algae]